MGIVSMLHLTFLGIASTLHSKQGFQLRVPLWNFKGKVVEYILTVKVLVPSLVRLANRHVMLM